MTREEEVEAEEEKGSAAQRNAQKPLRRPAAFQISASQTPGGNLVEEGAPPELRDADAASSFSSSSSAVLPAEPDPVAVPSAARATPACLPAKRPLRARRRGREGREGGDGGGSRSLRRRLAPVARRRPKRWRPSPPAPPETGGRWEEGGGRGAAEGGKGRAPAGIAGLPGAQVGALRAPTA
ncbi:uncharacterized protein LOC143819688 isoform X2 [Paroedura picta]